MLRTSERSAALLEREGALAHLDQPTHRRARRARVYPTAPGVSYEVEAVEPGGMHRVVSRVPSAQRTHRTYYAAVP
jgi:hypothetical protein